MRKKINRVGGHMHAYHSIEIGEHDSQRTCFSAVLKRDHCLPTTAYIQKRRQQKHNDINMGSSIIKQQKRDQAEGFHHNSP